MVLCVTAITKVGDDPDEWRGFARGGRPVYVRYDRGHLTVNAGVARTHLAAATDRCVFNRLFDDAPQRLGYRHLKDLTKGAVEWPTYELPVTDEAAAKLITQHADQRRDEVDLSTAEPIQLNVYIAAGRLLMPRGQSRVEAVLSSSPDHNCRRMGCTEFSHVLLRR